MLSDSLTTEKKYLSYMNSTISHEMRNPLNSIMAQVGVFESLIDDMNSIFNVAADKLTTEEVGSAHQIIGNFKKCLNICGASCKLLLFNVEDILALPRLKEGRFTKNI